MKFLVDQMLGTLAKWLRLFGFDTYFAKQEVEDDVLLLVAKGEQRTLVTRDKELYHRAIKKEIPVIFTSSTSLTDQLIQIFSNYPNAVDENTILNRCSVCNTILHEVKKERIESHVPSKVFQNHHHFWQCPTCNRIYWKGTHYKKILQTINEFKK